MDAHAILTAVLVTVLVGGGVIALVIVQWLLVKELADVAGEKVAERELGWENNA